MVDDVMPAQNSRIPQELLEGMLVIQMKYGAVCTDGANVMNSQILDANLQVYEYDFAIQRFFTVHEMTMHAC